MRRLSPLVVLLLLASACGGDGGTASTTADTGPSTTASTTTTPGTTAAPTTTRPRPTTTTRPEPIDTPTGGRAALPAYAASPYSFSPWAPGFDPVVGQAHLAGAWDVDPYTLDMVPDLVVELPTVANGGVAVRPDGSMTVSYRIRPEATWEDDTPVSGADFAFTYSTITALGLDEPGLALYQEITPESVSFGDKAFSYTLPRATVDYELLFEVVLPRHAVTGTDVLTGWGTRPWPSAGPFRFQEWAEGSGTPGSAGSVAVFVRNEAYWETDAVGNALPYLDGVEFHFVAGAQEAIQGFAEASFDAVGLGSWPDAISRLQTLEGVRVEVGNGTVWEHLAFQFGENDRNQASLNGSATFRRAVAHALDREALAATGPWVNEGPLTSFLDLTEAAAGGEGWDRYAYDPDLARALLEDACAAVLRDCQADPPVVVLTTTSNAELRRELGRAAVDMLKAVGIDARLVLEDSALFFGQTFDRGDWDLGLWAWPSFTGLSGVVRTLEYWDPAGPPPMGANYQRWGTPEVEGFGPNFDQGPSTVSGTRTARYAALVDEMRRTADTDRLRELVAEAEEILADQVVIIPLATRGTAVAWWAGAVAGIRHHPGAPYTWGLERWYRADLEG